MLNQLHSLRLILIVKQNILQVELQPRINLLSNMDVLISVQNYLQELDCGQHFGCYQMMIPMVHGQHLVKLMLWKQEDVFQNLSLVRFTMVEYGHRINTLVLITLFQRVNPLILISMYTV